MLNEPIAIVGIGCLTPHAANKSAFSDYLHRGQARFAPLPLHRYWETDETTHKALRSWHGAFFETFNLDCKQFRIPPIYKKAVSNMMLMLLQVADECVRDAGFDTSHVQDDVDVFCGTCFGFNSTVSNALKIAGIRIADTLAQAGETSRLSEFRERLSQRFGTSSHDRVGEMASTIPARIASRLSLRGHVKSIENADATGYSLLEAAIMALHSGQSRAVLVASGQCMESLLMPLSLIAKGFYGDANGHPFSLETTGTPIGEGATALLLKRLSDAHRDQDRIYSVIGGLSAIKRDTATGFRYPGNTQDKYRVIEEACAQAGIEAGAQQYIDCVLPGIGSEYPHTLGALGDTISLSTNKPIYLGATTAVFGHTFANSTLAAVAACSLALYQKSLPPLTGANRKAMHQRDGIMYCHQTTSWPKKNGEHRIAGIHGSSLTGLSWHIVLSEVHTAATSTQQQDIPSVKHEPIAIVGLGGAFSQCASSSDFWRQLLDGLDAVQPVPDNILSRRLYFHEGTPQALSSYACYGADLKHRDFDLSVYKIFPKRAASMDIAQQLALNVAAEALRDFKLDKKRSQIGRTAIVLASNLSLGRERELNIELHENAIHNTLLDNHIPMQTSTETAPSMSPFTFDGCLASGSAALISNCFNLQAVPIAVEAACASSLAAFHHAVLALRQHRYDLVLTGGVELPVNTRDFVLCASQMMLSQEQIAPFSEGADGFSPGDGAAIFVLKRLSDAQRDHDHVYATITGIAGSVDAVSMTAPDPDGQTIAMLRAFEQAGYASDTVQYVEAHGTGTRLGDVAEIRAISQVYSRKGRTTPLKIGSVKSNIGHAFAAAGSAGLLKTVLALKHRMIPATLMRRKINEELPLAEIPAEIVMTPQPWETENDARYAGISSFGTGGINYHLLIKSSD